MEVDSERFSIREYTRKIRSVEVRKCWPFSGEINGDLIHSLLPPITVVKFRWWSHELASLLAKSPMAVDDSDPSFQANVKSRPCKKRSIVEIFAAPQIQGDDPDVLVGSKRKIRTSFELQKNIKSKRSKDSGDQKFPEKVNKSKEQSLEMVDGEKCSLGIKESSLMMPPSSKKAGLVCKDQISELQIPAILKANRKVCLVRSPQCERPHVRFSDQSELRTSTASSELCCLEMNRLSLSSSEAQLRKVMSNDQSSVVMRLESRQQDKFQHEVSERQSSHCFLEPYLTSLERVKVALDLERKKQLAQPVQSFISSRSESPYRACSSFSPQPASADMHCGTLMHQSSLDPLLVEWMEKSVLYRQRHVGEEILGFPLNLQGELVEANGEGCISFDRSSLGTGSSESAATENDVLLGHLGDCSFGNKHSTEPYGAGRFPAHNEKRHMCFPARLGIDETFAENTFFISDTNAGKCDHTMHSPVSEVNTRSHTINLPQRNGHNQNIGNRNMVTNCDGLCLHNTQATMRLMGKDVSVGTSYSDMVRTNERIVAPDCSFLESHSNQSWLWRRTTTLGVSENHSTTTLDKNWNRAYTSKDPFTLFCEPHVSSAFACDSEFPPCCSLASFPSSDKNLSFHGSGLEQPSSFTFNQQQLPFLLNYNNVDTGLLPDARNPYSVLPFSCTDSTIHWPQSSSESSCSGMSFINSTEQLVSLYGSKSSSSSYINVGTANQRVASIEEYTMQNHRVPKFSLQEFYGSQQIRRQI